MYSSLKIIKIYNSTIQKWDSDAALTKSSHPKMSILMLTRVNTPNGQLPLGLQRSDFPPTLGVFGFIVTNLRELPDDIASKWPARAIFQFDTGNFSEIPVALLHLAPRALGFAANPVSAIPAAIFELPEIEIIDFRDTLISQLPSNVSSVSTTLTSINLDGTNMFSFPPWIDKWLTFPGDLLFPERISAAESPYCIDRGRIFAGEQTDFTQASVGSSLRLQDASKANWEYLKRGVACTPTVMYRYPLALEDAFNQVI